MLHSLGASFSQKENKISLYTTNYSKYITNANTTFSLKEILKTKGFNFNPDTKNWEIEFSEENTEKVLVFLKQYDSKAWPQNAGLVQCWECGCWVKPSREGQWDTVGYYCGC